MSGHGRQVTYERRHRGMDHGLYEWENLFERPAVEWPGGASVAVWVCLSVEWFRFDSPRYPVDPIGSPMVEYPDFWGFTRLDYGNRVGIYRVLQALERHDARVTAALNSEVVGRYPFVVEELLRMNAEIIGHGRTSSELMHEGMSESDERALIEESLAVLRGHTGQPVHGWLSPSLSESRRTLGLLAEQGIEYVCDWANDDLPFEFWQPQGLRALPYSNVSSDLHVIAESGGLASTFRDQLVDQLEALLEEVDREGGTRCMCIALHPWVIGVPHRIKYLEEALAEILGHPKVWSATAGELLHSYEAGTT